MHRGFYAESARKWMLTVAVLVLVFCAGTVCNAQFSTFDAWHHYIDVNVDAGGFNRSETPVEFQVNFTDYIPGKTMDLNSVRVAEFYDDGRQSAKNPQAFMGAPGELPSQFDEGPGFDAATNAVGEVVWILNGGINVGAPRYFRIYFDTTEWDPKSEISYLTDLGCSSDWSTDPAVSNSAYSVTYKANVGSILKLQNLLSYGTMWAADGSNYLNYGLYYTTEEYDSGWIDQTTGTATATNILSKNRSVRLTVTTTRNAINRHKYTVVRKFYAGTVPYFKNEVKIEKYPGAQGGGFYQHKDIRWNDTNVDKRTVISSVPQTDPITGMTMPYDYICDYDSAYGVGGFGLLMSHDYRPTVYDNSGSHMPACSVTRDNNRYWRYNNPWYPFTLTHAVAVHTGTTEETTRAEVENILHDYGCPVNVIVKASGTVSARGVVSGMVTDADNSTLPVKGATVIIRSGNFFAKTYTSMFGDYSVSNVPTGSATISVKRDGYDTVVSTRTIVAGVNTVNASLLPFGPSKQINLASTTAWQLATDSVVYPYVELGTDVARFAAPTVTDTLVPVTVPAEWDSVQGTSDQIYGWYRTSVTVPSSWAGRNLRIRDFCIDDVAAVYMNGHYIGKTGTFPAVASPRSTNSPYATGASAPCDYIIPASAVNFGGTNILAIKVFDNTGIGGIHAGGPILEMAPVAATVTVEVTGAQVAGDPALPVEGATIQIAGTGLSGTTDANGRCVFYGVPGDKYSITASSSGYDVQTVTSDIPESGSITIPITYYSFQSTVTGIVKRSGLPVADARVILTGATTMTARTGSDGRYTISPVPGGDYLIAANALNAAPLVDQPITVNAITITKDINLAYGYTPMYDDFSGTEVDMYDATTNSTARWRYFNADILNPENAIATIVSPPINPENTCVSIESVSYRGGIVSTTTFPKYATYEFVTPRKYNYADLNANQNFALRTNTDPGTAFQIEMNEQGTFDSDSEIHYKLVFGDQIAHDFPKSSVFKYPLRVSILRTGNYYDVYYKGIWQWGGSTDLIPDRAYIYLYGYEQDGGNTIAYFDDVRAGATVAVPYATLSQARSAEVNQVMHISEAVVTASFDDAFWVESADRSSGIKVISTAAPDIGAKVLVAGKLVKVNNEIALQAQEVVKGDSATIPSPVGITGKVAGEFDKAGAAAQGLLVKVSGKVTGYTLEGDAVSGYYLDDGSGLAGDGINKGLYVMVKPSWNCPTNIVGEFKTFEGPLTVHLVDGSTPLPAVRVAVYTEAPTTFTAYNDIAATVINEDKVTTYTKNGQLSGPNGYLKDYDTGDVLNSIPGKMAYVSISMTDNLVQYSTPTAGTDCRAGTDADLFFGGKVSLSGCLYLSSTNSTSNPWNVGIAFSQLDPNGLYEVVCVGNRNSSSGSYTVIYNLSGAVGFENKSSAALGHTLTDPNAVINTQVNTYNGYVARWRNVQPATGGTFNISIKGYYHVGRGFPLNAFMLRKQSGPETD